jgi:hypothetical protein
MTTFQQAVIHAVLVLIAVVAVVVLAVTGNGNETVYGLILALTGFGAVGVAGVGATSAPPAASSSGVKDPPAAA